MRIDVARADLDACVSCGLCLPHCPTYRVTGEESASPRGRIAAMRVEQASDAPASREFRRFMELCIQCRGCEAACPSAVPFGHLMEEARRSLRSSRPGGRWRRLAYAPLAHHRVLLGLSTLLGWAQRARLVPRRLGLPPLDLRRPPLRSSGEDVWLFTGCVMDAWMRPVHASALEVMGAMGVGARLSGPAAACCGALHLHAGWGDRARTLAERVIEEMPGEGPVVVDSAGCGATMADYGRLLGTEAARRFSARVIDVNRWLADHLDRLPPAGEALPGPVAVQDPCHLRHVQGGHQHVRTVLRRYVELVELDDDGLCCGAGGAYSVTEPDMAVAVRRLKLAAIDASGAETVASANPGCIVHLAAGGVRVRHPVEIVAEAIRKGGPG